MYKLLRAKIQRSAQRVYYFVWISEDADYFPTQY